MTILSTNSIDLKHFFSLYNPITGILFGIVSCVIFIGCTSREPNPADSFQIVWERELTGISTHSSPRTTDLTGNGVLDVVIGAGRHEMEETHIGVIAMNGATGDTLWTLPARDQVFGSPAFLDITGNGTQDILINGRAGILIAIDGTTGTIIWEFLPDVTFEEAREQGIYNFYNPQLIPDQNGDSLPDILVANGGDFTIPPYDEKRPAGTLMILSSADGELLARATVPDGKETYMSAVVARLHNNNKRYSVIFGTGGETIGGSLYVAAFTDILKEDLSGAIQLASHDEKGFIAPPVLADINGDGVLDIVVNSVGGRTLAFSGSDYARLWEIQVENTEVYGSLAAGHFTDLSRADFLTTYSIGVWPDLRENYHILINGSNGEIIHQDTLGIFQTASPISADLTGRNRGLQNGLISINIGYEQFDGSYHYNHMLVGYDFLTGRSFAIDELRPGANLSSTPWAGDLDGNSRLDIVYSVSSEHEDIFGVNNLIIRRLQSQAATVIETNWGSYMGSSYNGVYRDD